MRAKRIVSLGAAAQADLDTIAAWTTENFGPSQAKSSIEAILDTIDELTAQRSPSRSLARDEIAKGMRTLHKRKRGRRGRHFLLYAETEDEVKVQRVPHDNIELAHHLPRKDV